MEDDYLKIIEFRSVNPLNPPNIDGLQHLIESIPIGLSPHRYTKKKPLFIIHGHQLDFWNCDEHNFIGKMITNGVGVPADGIDALPYKLQGIDLSGNPVLKFSDIVTSHTPWNTWPPADVARRQARIIEQTVEIDRRLQDSPEFSESLAALFSLLLKSEAGGNAWWDQGVQILLGHTHYPQSRPYLSVSGLTFGQQPEIPAWVKAPYYNCGTGGWWEGIIWAIEITEIGQPRLVYWDGSCYKPNLMAWELQAPETDWVKYIRHLNWILRHLIITVDNLPRIDFQLYSFSEFIDQTRAVQFDLGMASKEQQRAYLASVFLYVLRSLGNNQRPLFPLTISINVKNLPICEVKPSMVDQTNQRPNISISDMFKKWMDYLGIGNTWKGLDNQILNKVITLFFYCAYLYKSDLLHNIGYLIFILFATGKPLKSKYDKSKNVYSIQLT